jgi:DHA2 family multidrug resistance protein-like MFS transporter
VAEAEELPGPLGTELVDVAREAFAQGLQLTAVTTAIMVAAAAIAATVLLRQVRRDASIA